MESSDSHVDMSCWYWEASEHEVENVRVKGHLKQHILYWRDVLIATPYIIDIIENGYRLLVIVPPTIILLGQLASLLIMVVLCL